MAYSESLALRIRQLLAGRRGIVEKKMFGGVGFLLNGNMCVGVWKQSLIVRLSAEAGEAALQEADVVAFDITGRPMKGWIMVEPDGVETEEQLRSWMGRGVEFVERLPRK
jgi:TfoX/Sxy family transcriptional regulator of competence genes